MHEDFHTILPFYTLFVPEVFETPGATPLYNGIDGIASRRDGASSTVDGASDLLPPDAVQGMGSDDVNAEAAQQRAQRLTHGMIGVYFTLLCIGVVVLGFCLRIN